MAIILSAADDKLVATKRRKPSSRPKYYNAELKAKITISEDFEAFLILLGPSRSTETLKWLNLVNTFGTNDADRDALVSQMLVIDTKDASNKYIELRPIVRQFNFFRNRFNISGFEDATEPGLLLADLQRAMSEIKVSGDRWNYQNLLDKALTEKLTTKGMTQDVKKQLNSWVSPLTSY